MSLDPKTNRQQREAEKAKKAAEEPSLNPLFPHKRQAFDPFFFSLDWTPGEGAGNVRPEASFTSRGGKAGRRCRPKDRKRVSFAPK